MDSLHLQLFTLLACLIVVQAVAGHGHCKEKEFTGCNRVAKQCICSTEMACHNPFTFRDVRHCQRALFGNSCHHNDCENKGQCVQTKGNHVYLCKCEGTGFYGPRCEIKCPNDRLAVPSEDRHQLEPCIF